ncbi:MAG TPA: hypothetical protein PKL44_02325, partial [Candidatus Dojkabacteria bacterium]|nr:hypothetical protein [Candidatus Dojkabacteria bacterium]
MPKLSILEKNSYINILIKDNGIWVHLAYMDYNANREYILSDYTDLNALKFLLDDNVFTKEFWFDFFNNLEAVFNWNIVDKDNASIFTFRPFHDEGDGVSGVRVQIDDNQPFFQEIFNSVREFSNDVSLRVIDDRYMESLLQGLATRLAIDDLMILDMDLFDFSIFRVRTEYEKGKSTGKYIFSKSKLKWEDEISLIDSIKDTRFKAFLSADLSSKYLVNTWANFVVDRPLVVKDEVLIDVIRSYATIQNFSIFRDNKEKIQSFGKEYTKNALIITGNISRVLGKSKTLLSIIDGLELTGSFDVYFDQELKTIAFGKSLINETESTDIILTRGSIIPKYTKVIIPNIKNKISNKVILSGKVQSLEMDETDFYVLSSQYTFLKLPKHKEKLVISASFREGVKSWPLGEKGLEYVSAPGVSEIDSILFDFRSRPIIYGPDAYSNKIKLKS